MPHVANQEPPRTARRRSRPRPRADRGATSLAHPPPKGGLALAYLGVDELRPYDGNPRTHSSTQVAELARSIERFGFAAPVLAERDGTVIAGHGRLEAAKLLGMQRVPVVRLHHLTPEQARALRLADNRLAELSEWDEELLARELGELADLKIDLDGLGWDDDRLRELLGLELEPEPPAPELEDAPRVLITKLGDLWSLGEHRLLCGDSTNREHLARLMEGELATLLATDPPYLVDYQEEGWDSFGDDEQGGAFFTAWLKVALEHCTERVPVYQWHASRRQVLVEQGWRANGLLLHQTIIWVKSRAVPTRSHFMWQHEPCFYGWREGRMPERDRRPTLGEKTVWPIDQAGQLDGIHPTQKPTAVFERPMRWHTRAGEVVLEPFSGSGSQLVAAELTKRRCRALELSPEYCDASLRRWRRLTNVEPTCNGVTLAERELQAGVSPQ